MLTVQRFVILVVAVVLSIHFILASVYQDYLEVTSRVTEHLKPHAVDVAGIIAESLPIDSEIAPSDPPPEQEEPRPTFSYRRRANATLVMLCRNSDINGVVSSIQQMEDRFNKIYNYPWVLLNEEPFTEEFKRRVSVLTEAPLTFGQIPPEHWYQPDWIDEDRARQERMKMERNNIIYGGSLSYRNMCRFNSGFFFHHELLAPYKYYWRPDVNFFCDIPYDPFIYMEDNDKIYGFTISLIEWEATIPTLWSAVKEFMTEYPEYIQVNNSMSFLSDDGGRTYNLCHYWSNFEIADMDFWRGEAYQEFFNYLERKGGFYYERWGDAPVHSIGASLLARRDQIHFFSDIGYRHSPFQHCPSGDEWTRGRCSCDPGDSFDYAPGSCLRKYEGLFS